MASTIFDPVQIEFLKRQAKRLHRDSGLPLSQCLDQLAMNAGYSNWSLLMKNSTRLVSGVPSSPALPPPFQLQRSAEAMRQALRKVSPSRYKSRGDAARESVADICHRFVSAENAVDFAIEYMTCLLAMPRFHVSREAPAFHEMRHWLPYIVHEIEFSDTRILVNRRYKPVGDTADQFVVYEAFSHLHLRLPTHMDGIYALSPEHASLFNDGCPPWDSRQAATSYLTRLKRLRECIGQVPPIPIRPKSFAVADRGDYEIFNDHLIARWAAFFNLAGWQWEHKPSISVRSWHPDFKVTIPCSHSECGGDHVLLVAIKPINHLDEAAGHPASSVRWGSDIETGERVRADAGAVFGNSPGIESWEMGHGAGGGMFDILFWEPSAHLLWEQAGQRVFPR